MTADSPPSMTATQELVVPRSMPMILLMCCFGRWVMPPYWQGVCQGKNPLFVGF
jgi:hypothetical protein